MHKVKIFDPKTSKMLHEEIIFTWDKDKAIKEAALNYVMKSKTVYAEEIPPKK